MSKMIQELETAQMGKEIPVFNSGDTVIVHVKVVEGERERLGIRKPIGPQRSAPKSPEQRRELATWRCESCEAAKSCRR